MFITMGAVYTGDRGRVRITGIFYDKADNDRKKVIVNFLEAPGGRETMDITEFEGEYEEVDE